MLTNKTVLLGVSGSIAAYKIATLASSLVKLGADVHVLMTKNGTQFITPVTFETLTGNKCLIDTFDRNFEFSVEHVSLAKRADLVMIAPATANIIGKLACGIADDMLTTTVLACTCPKYIAPAMNTAMYENAIVRDNLDRLASYGFRILSPASGRLACGDVGAGKLPEPELLLEVILQELEYDKDLLGRRILVTAGPTQEALDPVRFLTNHSSGKMGYALAQAASRRGAKVTLVSGPTSLDVPYGIERISVTSAQEMFEAVTERFSDTDIVIKAAAVADYRPASVSSEKMKKGGTELTLPLERTRDILSWLGEHKREDQLLIGFSMETEHLLENSRRKLEKKRLDLIAANSIREEGAGFAVDTNRVTLISREDETTLPLLTKEETAHRILDRILEL